MQKPNRITYRNREPNLIQTLSELKQVKYLVMPTVENILGYANDNN